jgi:hypothetical protein
MNNWTNEELQRTLNEVARRSTIDPEFRALALENGAEAISKINPKPLTGEMKFHFVDNSGVIKTIPLPDPLLVGTEELSDCDLENVAGGGDPPPVSGGWSKIAPLDAKLHE